MLNTPDCTVSLRWLIPFMRISGAAPADLEILQREGIGLKEFADPDARIRHAAVMELLAQAVEQLHDPRLGLRAGELHDLGDFYVLEYAARSCANLRDAVLCCNRYMYLMNGALEARLFERDDLAVWELRALDDVRQPPAANDFTLTCAVKFAQRHTGMFYALREVHFRHDVATDEAAYARIFDGAKIVLGARHNALVFARDHLDAPMSQAHAGLQAAFELHAKELLERLTRVQNIVSRVRRFIIDRLRTGDVSLETTAQELALTVSSLRRQLADEGTSFRQLLDDVRRQLALSYLAEQTLSISDVAFLLGFSHVTGFYKAFRRWSIDVPPAAFRMRQP